MKRILIIAIFTAVFISQAFCEENILNRVFFKDFEMIGADTVNFPVNSIVTGAALAGTTLVLMNYDADISREMQRNKNATKDQIFDYVNYLGEGVVVLAADTAFFLGGEKEKRTGEKVIEALAVSNIIAYPLKYVIGRERPSKSTTAKNFAPFSGDQSMPSGHTTVAFSWATIVGDNYKIGYITYPLAVAVGAARIYRNAHWASDVVLGAFIGTVTAKVINYKPDDDGIVIKADIKDGYNGVMAGYYF